ncbi:uncharacterized protein BP5553_10067 [Venustampulla echinocandica]|uniref:Uncharacterized protein n=1 Tax=Venustampulla echinocandica TaxID=2656787 RepID=A0A370TA97_9HELO|nr:uncharacterized protein BP5553_10067 [Venustampulla echinocandica]RDL30722.1 hypothetical protein BP5553_10067 [Venustampulla echinocandica]
MPALVPVGTPLDSPTLRGNILRALMHSLQPATTPRCKTSIALLVPKYLDEEALLWPREDDAAKADYCTAAKHRAFEASDKPQPKQNQSDVSQEALHSALVGSGFTTFFDPRVIGR